MSIVVIGVNHRTGPLSVLERLAIAPDDVAKAVVGLAARDNIREVAVLSTCNRIEVYAVAERFHGAYADIRDFLCELGRLAADELHPYLYSQHDDAAARHLFEVAAGLDSAVLGESEILGQVRAAWQVAKDEGGVRVDARPAVPPRPAGRQAGPHRDRHRPGHGVDQPRRRRDGHRSARLARRTPGARRRRRRDGRRRGHRAAPGRRRRDRRVQPHARSAAPAGRAGRRPGPRPRSRRRGPGVAATSSSPARRRGRASSPATTSRPTAVRTGRC